MPGLLIIAHAPLASALYGVAAHVYPDGLTGLAALDVPPDWPVEQVEQAAREALASVRDPQALILTDVFGATPCNVAQRLADGNEVRLVTGVNVPMMWRALSYLREPVDSLVTRAVAGGTQGVMQVAAQRPQNQPQSSRLHDQDHAHHQQ
ncbi:MAG TPA: PTS fructose transporter subunit IIA [Ideonella sp.]|uniref:PTS sugar transporter subunit IIA n=1 Tax=Ideonella sp. TaxID=1929293 RepID=UPI002C4F26B8|nr:PTS fructose transporter subunit IIA [Ideonella sp.]HSI46818.1 PTS fructose transporter subunit IIA [Ideonella sp.]